MKRVAVIAILLAVMASLFAFPGYATTYNPTTYNSYTDAVTVNGVTYNVRVTQLKALSEGTSLLPGGMETIMLVTLQMTNNTNSVKAATIPKLTLDLSDERVITDVFTYGGDFILGLMSGGIGIFYPGSEFSLDNNKVVVPPNKSLYCVGAIGLPAQLSQDGSSTLDTGLRGVHLYDKANYSVTDGNYSYGNPVDLSLVISYIDGIESALTTSNNNTTTIINRLNSIITLLTYSGSNYSPSIDSYTSYNSSPVSTTVTNFFYQIVRVNSATSYINNDIEIDNGNDVTYQTGTKELYSYIKLIYINNTNKWVQVPYTATIIDALPAGNISFDITCLDNQFIPSISTGRRLQVNFIHGDGNYGYVAPRSRVTANIVVRINYDDSVVPTWNNPSLSSFTCTSLNDAVYYPVDEYSILRDLYMAYSEVNGLDDIDDITEDITDKSESAHTQEQSYFTQNAQAIEATGLSNYRFSGDQENGIGSVSHDFTLLWNSLGGFNSIYIFSLTLSLALMVLRHAPGMIRSSRRNKEE